MPWATLLVACVSVAACFSPRWSELLVYDRQAVLNAELWRLATASLVHFSGSHLFWNLLVFAVAGLSVETEDRKGFLAVCALAALLPSITYVAACPEVARYGGLSGLSTGAMAYLCLHRLRDGGSNGAIWLSLLALIGVKAIFEIAAGTTLFVSLGEEPFRVLTSVHVMGFGGALCATLWAHSRRVPRRTAERAPRTARHRAPLLWRCSSL